MDEKLQNRRKKTIIVFVMLILVAALFGIGILIFNNRTIEAERESEENSEVARDKYVVFYNLDLITEMYDIKISTKMAEMFEEFVLGDAEMKFSGENSPVEDDASFYYDATIDLNEIETFGMLATKIRILMSDGRVYFVILETDRPNEEYGYLYMAVLREGASDFEVLVDGDESSVSEFEKSARERYNN